MKGKHIILAAASISGISVFINSLAVKALPNAYYFTTAKNIITAFFIFSFIFLIGKSEKIKKLSKKDWQKLYILGLLGGSVPFLLFFHGLSILTTVGNGAFIQKTMFIWVAIISYLFLKEKASVFQQIGLTAVLTGIVLMGGFKFQTIGSGEVYVFIATIFWSIEAILVNKFAKEIDSDILAFGRMFFGSMFMLSYLLMTQESAIILANQSQAGWVLITSGLLFTYVMAFYRSLAKFKASEVSAILTIAFPITVICQSLYAAKPISNILPVIWITVGVIIFSISNKQVLSWRG
jgi:drug/metabolite transporter (DMT)-like permease